MITNLTVYNVFILNRQKRPTIQQKTARIITNLGVVDHPLAELPNAAKLKSGNPNPDMLQETAKHLCHSRQVTVQLQNQWPSYDPRQLNPGLSGNKEFFNRVICLEFTALIWYHFLVRPILSNPQKTATMRNNSALGKLIHHLNNNSGSTKLISRAELADIPHLSIVTLHSNSSIPMHAVVILEVGSERVRCVWETHDVDPAVLTPLQDWHIYQDATLYLAARFQDAPNFINP